MERIPNYAYAELISEAYYSIPDNILPLVSSVHFFCGTDPVYAGLTNEFTLFETETETETETTATPKHTTRNSMFHLPAECQTCLPKDYRYSTIVIPNLVQFGVCDVVHELGHQLSYVLWDYISINGVLEEILPVTKYAETNIYEAFAESFVTWLYWGYGEQPQGEILGLFEKLKNGESLF